MKNKADVTIINLIKNKSHKNTLTQNQGIKKTKKTHGIVSNNMANAKIASKIF
jgi:hypothetical protein